MSINRRQFKLSTLAGTVCAGWDSLWGRRTHASEQQLAESTRLPAGPLVGGVTDSTASIWVYTPGQEKVDAHLVEKDRRGAAAARIEVIDTDGYDLPGRAWKVTFAGLPSAMRLEYQVVVDGESSPHWRGGLTTSPKAGAPTKFRLGLTSCMKIEQPQTSWPLFLAQSPDLHLTLGDTVYADTTDPRIQWRHHLRYRQSPEFAHVIRAMPTYSMWDDHDFGPNNSDGTARGKENSLLAWERVWLNPGAGTAQTPGAFYRFAWGDVDFFVVDGRYHRTPNKQPDDEQKTMLGEAQFHWLVEGLKASRARFKVVASGSTLQHSQADGWRVFTHQRRRLFDAIKTHKINGVVYMSGSPHNSWAWEHHESDRVGYPLVEVVSSGIANSKRLSFATVDFDTTIDDPTMAVRVVQGNGKLKQNDAWKLSQLSHT